MKKIIKYVLVSIEASVLFVVVGALTTAITKNIYADILIEQFKAEAVYDEENSTNTVKLYKIESTEERPALQRKGTTILPGNTGDILISLNSELNIPFIKEFVSFFAGGHAAMVLGDYQDYLGKADVNKTLESTGMNPGLNLSTMLSKQYWSTNHPYKEVIGLRVRTTEAERKRVLASAMALEGAPYNYSFLFDTKNKAYCSDLINKAYQSIGVDLNKDGFTTSVYDLLVSKETYISYYHFYDGDGVKHIYYLDVQE